MKPVEIFMHLSLFYTYRIYLALIILLMVGNIAKAVEISNIYQVDIPVKEQSNNARWKASLEGLKLVLVRRSGSQRILNSNEASEAFKKVTSYLQSSQYSREEEVIDEYKYIISLYFEPRLIDELIKRANQSLWDINRPVSILWLAHEEVDQYSTLYRRIITENENEIIINDLISKNSKRRGVPVILPLMDLDDSLLVSQSDVWGRFPEAIVEASNRYSVDSIIIGKIYQRSELWFGQFTYFNQSKNISFEYQSDNVDLIYKQMFDGLAETLCEQYCVTQTVSAGHELLIGIENITNFEIFQKIKNYLSDLSAVRQVDVVNIHQDEILFRLSLLSNEKVVIESLRLNRRLKFIEKPVVEKIGKMITLDNTLPIEGESDKGAEKTRNSFYQEEFKIEKPENTKDSKSILKSKTIYYRWVN
ncbi:MAG: hypothetical protein COB38_05580 [Gammaproteobacteria bacterium]|nr:MAG: hypothetical protein COB38_05580 [Gammaproteobacteria bacterium]